MNELECFGKRLKLLRTEKKMTQKELGMALGIRNSVISFYEVGERIPSPEVLIKVAKYFRVSTDYLLGLDEDRGGIDTNELDEGAIAALGTLADMLRNSKR